MAKLIKYAQKVPTDEELIGALREIYEKLNQDDISSVEVAKLQEDQKYLINELASRGSLLRAYYELGG